MSEAVRLLEGLMAIADDVEADLNAASLAEDARQSVLKAAFEGRLVGQGPSEEPADHLLARLAESDVNNDLGSASRRRRRPALAAE
jgi:type I restriction enzyme S subunit